MCFIKNIVDRISSRSAAGFIFQVSWPFRYWILAQLFVWVLWAIDISLRPLVLKIIVDRLAEISSANVVGELSAPVFFYVFMSGVNLLGYCFYDYIRLQFYPLLKRDVVQALMGRMMDHSHSLYQSNFSGSIANKISDAISGVPNVVKLLIDHFFSNGLALIFAVYAVCQASPKFGIAMAVWAVFFIVGSIKLTFTAKTLATNAAAVRSTVIGYVVDILTNMVSVRFFNGKKQESENLEKVCQESIVFDRARDWFFMRMHFFQQGSFMIFQSACLWWLVSGIKAGHLTPGDFVLVLTLNISIIDCLSTLSWDIREFAESLGNVIQGLRIIDSPLQIQDVQGAQPLVVSSGEVRFKNVSFGYSGSRVLFKNCNVVIPAGQKVGLVGFSGSGKTTFINLILRLYDVHNGEILVDGQNIANVTQDSLRYNIGVIPQEAQLFHRSVMENIRYGKFGATDEDVFRAAKQAFADEFISELEQGYNTLAGERGVKLSGGQRQRIAIARVALKDPKILIFDEATSQLDSKTESQIQQSMANLMQGRTSLVIAHRLSTIMSMDRILVFNKGEIVQDGTHEELLSQGGPYFELWNTQVGGFFNKAK